MKLENEFTVPASIDEAWNLLLDVPRVATCLPGATVDPGMGRMQGARTKKDGTYKLDSLPAMSLRRGGPASIDLLVIPPDDQPYLPAFKAAITEPPHLVEG